MKCMLVLWGESPTDFSDALINRTNHIGKLHLKTLPRIETYFGL